MRALTKILNIVAIGTALLFLAPLAQAMGLVTQAGALPPEARAELETQIAADRAAHPQAFQALANVKGHRPEHYRNNRNPYPTVARELRGLGPAALLPMLEALAFQAPERGNLSDVEWDALAAGMLDAVGILRDARARPVLHAAFETKGLRPYVQSAAARALGRLGGDAELALLTKHAVKGDALELHAIEGLGWLRRVESAKHLALRLTSTKDANVARAAASALGILGSSWAWRALGPAMAKQGLEVRKLCAQALATSYAARTGAARTAVGDAILMVEHPDTVGMLRAARPSSGAKAKAIDSLIVRVEKQLAKRQ